MAERFPADTAPADMNLERPLQERLRYDSPLHQQLISRLVQRRQLSERHISQRYDQWNQVDEHVQFYINLARKAKKADQTIDPSMREMPFERAIVIPASYATLMVRLTTLMTIFFARDPLIQIEGRGPEDMSSAKIMEGVLAYDLQRMKAPLVVYAALQDAEKYGLGIINDSWDAEPGWITRQTPMMPGPLGQMQSLLMRQMGITPTTREWGTVAEGNLWRATDPYLFWPDPRVPGQDLQGGEFCGHRTRRSYMYLYERSTEASGPQAVYINIEHLKKGREGSGRDVTNRRDNTTQRDLAAIDFRDSADEKDRGIFNIDSLQVKLIPREWGLSPERRPEIWWFAMADDSVIIRAHRSPHDHNRFTYSTMSPNFDAHTIFQQGNIENMDGLQRLMNWLYNSHMENVKRHLNDALIYSPKYVEEEDLLNPAPARHIRLTQKAEELIERGTHSAQSFVWQLPVVDVTQGHLREVETLYEIIHRMLGTNDPVSGQTTESKRTLGEVERIIAASGRRMALTAQLYDVMCLNDLAERAIQNRQQFTQLEQYIKITGELAQEQGIERLLVSKQDLQGKYDYVPISGVVPPDPSRFADIWMQILEGVMQIPQLQQPGPDGKIIDARALFKEAAEAMGARNIEQFFMQVAPVAPEVMPDDAVAQEVAAGNMIPAGEAEFAQNGHVQGAGI